MKNIMLDFMMGIICILLIITVIEMLALPCTLSAWSAMRLKEKLFNSELNNIQNKIEEAISQGKCYCYYYSNTLSLDIKQQLENLGYHVETYTQCNKTFYEISW